MLGLQSALLTCVHNLRIDELRISRAFRKLLVWNMALGKPVALQPTGMMFTHLSQHGRLESLLQFSPLEHLLESLTIEVMTAP